MNIVDLIFALGLFWFARKGWQIGLVQSLIMLFSVILAYGFALTYGETTARALFDTTEDLGSGTALFGFLVVFVAVLAACYFSGAPFTECCGPLPSARLTHLAALLWGWFKAH